MTGRMSAEQTPDIERVLAEHAGVNSTANWEGSPDPRNPRNIRRVCKCGEVIGWHQRRDSSKIPQPLSGYPFDEPHRAHVAQALAPVLAAAVREARAAAWDEGFNSDYEGDGWPPNPYRVSGLRHGDVQVGPVCSDPECPIYERHRKQGRTYPPHGQHDFRAAATKEETQ